MNILTKESKQQANERPALSPGKFFSKELEHKSYLLKLKNISS